MPRTTPPPAPPEDELDDLPPLDGATEDLEAELDDDEPLTGDGGSDDLDDSTLEDEPVDASELEVDEHGPSWLDDGSDSDGPDLGETGPLELRDEDPYDADDDGPSAAGEDFGFDDTERVVLDGGDEGPLDPDDELREEDLPSLDADDEGEGDDAAFWEGRLSAEEPAGFAWAQKPWLRVGAPLSLVEARALACVSRGALVCARTESSAREVVRVDLEGGTEPVPVALSGEQPVRRISADGGRVALVLDSGQLWIRSAEEGRFERVAAGVSVADAIVVGAEVWVRTSSGALLASPDGGQTLARCPVPGNAAAFALDCDAADEGGVIVLVTDDARQPLALVRGVPGGAVVRQPLDSAGAVGSQGLFAARGGSLAYLSRNERIIRRTSSGKAWESFEWEGKVTALSFIDSAGTLLAAVYSEADDATALVRIDAAARPAIVARVGALAESPQADGRVAAIVPDESRGVVWVAGGFGVAVFAVAAES
ncbi:MAG: hypothetical protein FWD17_05915 [Polyangiaceae bacterium]|nr:hypothetical protein [Polyangiaceae bacterium]